jgi:branched-subunit amino acid ABC-type transport system permease component
MPELLQFLLSGMTVGAVYALVALGFTIIYNASDVVNFAQGEFVMLGGMITFFAACRRRAAAACRAHRHHRHAGSSALRSTSWRSSRRAARPSSR